MPFIKTTNGTNLFYQDWGNGVPVILVAGWCQTTDGWEMMMHHLNDNGFRCIAYDQRGCGRSDKPGSGYDYHTLADDLATLIEKLGLDKVVLISHSLGCGIVTQYIADYGETHVKKVTFIGTITPNFAKSAGNPDGMDRANLDAAVAFMKQDRPAFVYSLVDSFFGPPSDFNKVTPHLAEWIVDLTLQASGKAAIEFQITAFTTNLVEELKQISLPVLILHGDQDTGPVKITAEATHKLLINSTLKVYKGRHHGMYITEPVKISEDIIEFINQG